MGLPVPVQMFSLYFLFGSVSLVHTPKKMMQKSTACIDSFSPLFASEATF